MKAMRLPETITTPGFIDLHVHLREPGTNQAETIASGTRAALLGGYVLLGDMPNNPGRPTWSVQSLEEKQRIISHEASVPVATHTGSQPESDNIGQLEAMSRRSLLYKIYAGATTSNPRDYEAADFRPNVEEWHRVAPERPIGLHSGKDNLEDFIALIAGEFKHTLLVHHVNSPEQVDAIIRAREKGWPVWAAVTPHHLLKTSHDPRSEGWFARMQPPLADQVDVEKLMYYFGKGYIHVIETDHAPHSVESKWQAETENPDGYEDQAEHTTCYGVPGIEFAAALMFYQASRGFTSVERVIFAMSTMPARILGVNLSSRTQVEWDMREYRIEEQDSTVQSGSRWTPFLGKLAIGVPRNLQISGQVLLDNGNIVNRDPRVISRRGCSV